MLLHPVASRPTVDFIASLTAASGTSTPPYAGSAIYNLPGLPPWGTRHFLIRALSYTAVENIGLEFDFYSSSSGGFLSRWQFTKADGIQLNGAGLYTYYIDGLAIPYVDLDTMGSTNPPTLHVAMQNADTVAKTAGAPGAVNAIFWVEAMHEGGC